MPNSSLSYRLTDPSDAALDRFDAGPEDAGKLVTGFFRKRRWLGMSQAPDCYQFLDGDLTVSFAAVGLSSCPHPEESSKDEAVYLVIYMMGLDVRYQGHVDPSSPARLHFSDLVLRGIESLVDVHERVGTYLWVRTTNVRAQRLYERAGFIADPGEYPRGGTTVHVMRRLA